ncbi:MAG TPA: thioredoxin family protein, partial [Chitinophagaceae bacterium]|nr:thioredoxin family protein [Chitinophagaceae bacterium]
YLAGVFHKKADGPRKKLSLIRIGFMLAFAMFTIYLVPGLLNSRMASLKLLSGFPPPVSYSIYKHHVLHAKGVQPIVNDFQAAIDKATKENKPLLLDFTGWACVNCRRMEEKVWTNAEVDSLMRTKFVVVSLYVDERTRLAVKDRVTFTNAAGEEETIETVGNKWTAFQKENFGAVSQPQYAILSPDQRLLTKTKFYTPDPGEFVNWLKCGLEAYDKIRK